MKHTEEFILFVEGTAKDDVESKAMYKALETALLHYQWHYQNASETKFVTVDAQTTKAIQATLDFLYAQGQDSVASEVEAVVSDLDKSTLTKTKVLTQAKRTMKATMLKHCNMKQGTYENKLATLMKDYFIYHCEELPLDEATEGMDIHFEPWYANEDMRR